MWTRRPGSSTCPCASRWVAVHRAVVVTAARAERETRQIPLHVETITSAAIEQANTLSTGDALTTAANITPVGNGPFGVRPRLRGLDSTRLLVLVDGERLNTARQATDRTGRRSRPDLARRDQPHGDRQRRRHAAVRIGRAGRHDQHHHQRAGVLADDAVAYGFNGFYSSNENGAPRHGDARRDRAALRRSASRPAPERYDNYKAGDLDVEDTRPFFAVGRARPRRHHRRQLRLRASTRFPIRSTRPTCAPSNEVPNSQAQRQLRQRLGLVKLGESRTLRVRYQRRRMNDVGFPDFAAPVLLQRDVAAAQQSRSRVGALRSAGHHAVAGQPVADRATTSAPSGCCRTCCRCSFRRRRRSRSSRSA